MIKIVQFDIEERYITLHCKAVSTECTYSTPTAKITLAAGLWQSLLRSFFFLPRNQRPGFYNGPTSSFLIATRIVIMGQLVTAHAVRQRNEKRPLKPLVSPYMGSGELQLNQSLEKNERTVPTPTFSQYDAA